MDRTVTEYAGHLHTSVEWVIFEVEVFIGFLKPFGMLLDTP